MDEGGGETGKVIEAYPLSGPTRERADPSSAVPLILSSDGERTRTQVCRAFVWHADPLITREERAKRRGSY